MNIVCPEPLGAERESGQRLAGYADQPDRADRNFTEADFVLVLREMEGGRSPLTSITPFMADRFAPTPRSDQSRLKQVAGA